MGYPPNRGGMSLEEFVERVSIYCSLTKASVTSFGRTPAHNKAVGGAEDSDHIYWRAMDVIYDEPVDEERRRTLAEKHGLFLLVEADHDHLAPIRRR